MAELRELAQAANVGVLDEMIQRRSTIDPRTLLGKGKLDELLIRAMQLGADAIIFDRELQAAQVRSISEATDLKVIDRSQLILDIFAQRAQSHEGKIQVELAQLKYILPRLVMGQNSAFSRLAGGIALLLGITAMPSAQRCGVRCKSVITTSYAPRSRRVIASDSPDAQSTR